MADYYKKRRIAGPSKNEQKVQREREQESRLRSAGTLGTRFPSVDHLKVSLEFRGAQQQVLGSEIRDFRPGDPCNFSAACPGQCGVGKFNLEGKIEKVIEGREVRAEGTGKCQEPLYAGAASVCGCELKCKIEINYAPEPARPEPSHEA